MDKDYNELTCGDCANFDDEFECPYFHDVFENTCLCDKKCGKFEQQ